jgi:foldase protein PrsA
VIRPLLRFFASALVLVVLASCAGADRAAAVGTAEITHEQVDADLPEFRFLTGLNGAPCGSPADGESQDAACARLVLTNGIREEIVKDYAAANGLSVDPSEVETAIGQLETNLGPEELQRQLDAAGVTIEDVEAIAERLLLLNVVQVAVVAERLGDEELEEIYEQSRTQFTTVEVRHILLETRDEAREVSAEVTPRNFGRLAEERSVDPGSASAGGSLGTFSEAQFLQQFDATFVAAALDLQPGEISDVVQTQFGFHVLQLVRRDLAPFDDVREQISAQEGPRVFDEWLRERYEELGIDVNPRYGRLDPESGEVVVIRSTGDGEAGPTGATAEAP